MATGNAASGNADTGDLTSGNWDTPDYDPLFLHARREAILIFLLWFACLCWCVPYCYINGYLPDTEEVPLMWGLPRWIVMGILGPWIIADIITVLFCVFIFREDDLGEVEGENEPELDSPKGKAGAGRVSS